MAAVLEFLLPLASGKSQYGTLNTYRSAISLLSTWDIGRDPTIRRFCRGVSVIKPQRPKYDQTWDPSIVLEFYSSREESSELKLGDLSKKLALLLLLVTAQRVQTLSKIKTANITFQDNLAVIKIPDRIKTTAVGNTQPNLIIPAFIENNKICPVKTLQVYLNKTGELRSHTNENLFITFKKPYRVATSQTISRWVKQAMMESGLDIKQFSAHSTRHASTSAAFRKGIDVETIRKTAGWANKSETFARFYNRPITNETGFAKSVIRIGTNKNT